MQYVWPVLRDVDFCRRGLRLPRGLLGALRLCGKRLQLLLKPADQVFGRDLLLRQPLGRGGNQLLGVRRLPLLQGPQALDLPCCQIQLLTKRRSGGSVGVGVGLGVGVGEGEGDGVGVGVGVGVGTGAFTVTIVLGDSTPRPRAVISH